MIGPKLKAARADDKCGPSNWPSWIRLMFFGWWFNKPCTRHDSGYSIGGSEFDRIKCDILFMIDLLIASVKVRWFFIPLALCVAICFGSIVLCFGWYRFKY